MAKAVHRLTTIDGEAGVCAHCGPVPLTYRKRNGKPQARCSVAVKQQRQSPRRHVGKHGLTVVEAKEFRAGKACAVCGSTVDLQVDHDHATGAVRETLCRLCNVGIGHFFDSPELLRAAAAYIESHRAAAAG